MEANMIADVWKNVVKIYNETEMQTPEKTMKIIVKKYGVEKAKEVFATIAAIKKYDGRIYGANRDYMNSIDINQKNVGWNRNNPVIYAGLDDIHTTHINQLITELKKLDK